MGSIETNFNAIGRECNKAVFFNSVTETIVNLGDDIPSLEKFLIPVEFGEEVDIVDGKLKKKLINLFKAGYIVKGLVRDVNNSYFYLSKVSSK